MSSLTDALNAGTQKPASSDEWITECLWQASVYAMKGASNEADLGFFQGHVSESFDIQEGLGRASRI